MRKYLLLLFIIVYVNMCQVVHFKPDGIPYSSVKKTAKKEKKIHKKVTTKLLPKVVTKTPKKASSTGQKSVNKTPHLVKKESTVTPKVAKKMTKEELFAKLFGKKKHKKEVKNLIVPLIVNKKFGRNTRLNIINGKHYIQGRDLKVVLMRFLSQRVLDKIFDAQNIIDGAIDLTILHQFSIDSYFDENDLAVYISIPPHIRIPTRLVFSKADLHVDEKFEKILATPAALVSGASNFYLKDSFRNKTNSTELEREAAVLRNSTFVNVKDYIFNSGFVLTEQNVGSSTNNVDLLTRDYTYMSKDYPHTNQRLKVGDISLTSLSKLGQQNILGASFVKHHDITRRTQQSIRVTDKEVFLENESQLEVYVNDRIIRTLTLQPGKHLLSDFPLITGLNHVKLKFHDIFGNEKVIDFDDFHYQELLKEGVETYGISMGIVASKDIHNNIVYDGDKQVFSANYNYGYNHDITLNNALQIHTDLSAYESEIFWGSTVGLFSAYGVVSHAKDYGTGYKYGFLYRNIIGRHNFTLKKEQADANYKSIGTDLVQNQEFKSLFAQIGTSPIKESLLSLSYTEREALGTASQRYALSYNQFFGRSWNAKIDLESTHSNGLEDKSVRFTLRYSPQRSRVSMQQVIEKQKDSNGLKEDNYRTELSLVKGGRFGLDGTVGYEEIENSNIKESLRARYSDQKYLANFDVSQTDPVTGSTTTSGSIGLSTALAFVNDNVAMTQPVGGSFILVQNDDYFKQKPLGIKSFNSDDPQHSFVIPASDYSIRELKVEDSDLIFGVDLKETHFKIPSKYKSGSLVQIAPEFILSAKGAIEDGSGKPVGLKVFKIYKQDRNGTMQPLPENAIFFTNHDGKFIISNMREGSYMIQEINVASPRSFRFSTKDHPMKEGIIDLGVIKLLKHEKTQKGPQQIQAEVKEKNSLEGYLNASKIVDDTETAGDAYLHCTVSFDTNQKACSKKQAVTRVKVDEKGLLDGLETLNQGLISSEDQTRHISY